MSDLVRDGREFRILQTEWRGNFGPDNHALRFAGRVDAHVLKLLHVDCVKIHPIGGITFRLRKIRLHEMCDVIRHRARDESGSNSWRHR